MVVGLEKGFFEELQALSHPFKWSLRTVLEHNL